MNNLQDRGEGEANLVEFAKHPSPIKKKQASITG